MIEGKYVEIAVHRNSFVTRSRFNTAHVRNHESLYRSRSREFNSRYQTYVHFNKSYLRSRTYA